MPIVKWIKIDQHVHYCEVKNQRFNLNRINAAKRKFHGISGKVWVLTCADHHGCPDYFFASPKFDEVIECFEEVITHPFIKPAYCLPWIRSCKDVFLENLARAADRWGSIYE